MILVFSRRFVTKKSKLTLSTSWVKLRSQVACEKQATTNKAKHNLEAILELCALSHSKTETDQNDP